MAGTLLVACGTSKTTQHASIRACNADPGGGKPTAEGIVVNTSSKSATFFIRLGFYGPAGNRITEGPTPSAASTAVGPGRGASPAWPTPTGR